MSKSITLKKALVWYFFLAAGLPLIIVSLTSLQVLTRHIQKEIFEKNINLAESLAGEVDSFLDKSMSVLGLAAQLSDKEYLFSGKGPNDFLEAIVRQYDFLDSVWAIDHRGIVESHAPFGEDLSGLDMSGQPFFREVTASGKPFWSDTFISIDTGRPTVTLARPLKNGVIAGYLDLESLNRICDRVRTGFSGYAAIVDNAGNTLSHPNRSFVAQRLNVRNLLVIQKGLSGKKGTFRYSFQGIEKIGSVAIVPSTGWLVVITQTVDDAFSPIKKLKTVQLTGLALSIIFALILAFLILRKTLMPLSRLNFLSKSIADGNYIFPSLPESYQEINELNQGFEVMSDAIREREAALKKSRETLQSVLDSVSDLIYTQDIEGRFLSANNAMTRIFGYEPNEFIGKKASDFMKPELRPYFESEYLERIKFCGSFKGITGYYAKDGRKVYLEFQSNLVIPQKGEPYISGSGRDATERILQERRLKKIQEQLQQAQKMEAIGTLAGGIAHDFNNLLQAIMGYTQIIMINKQKGDRELENLNEILNAGRRASDLTRQLLMFSRKVESRLVPTDLNQSVLRMQKLLKRTIPRMIRIDHQLQSDLGMIEADPGQIEQIIMNLCINAKDAMPEGGTIVIETADVKLDEVHCETLPGAVPGKYVMLSVTDSGQGMDRQTLEHIFEPFFTTKETGKGTGLGLSMVYGIVKKHNGFISCYSEPGQGTVLRIYFPVMEAEGAEIEMNVGEEDDFPGGTETILVTDDEKFLRDLCAEMLGKFGYTVLLAENGDRALQIYKDRGKEIALVILDLIMPGMGGGKCLDELIRENPEVKVLIASGYSTNERLEKMIAAGAMGFIRKPYNLRDLLKNVRRIIDEGK